MVKSSRAVDRVYVGEEVREVMELPNFVEVQTESYERFLQRERLKQGAEPLCQGLQEVFESTFPLESQNGDMVLEFVKYTLEEDGIKFSENMCKKKGLSYTIPVKATINLVFFETGEIRQKDIYMGDIPLMTDRGTFIINGAERVVVSQVHRSPGVIFSYEKNVYSSRIIPYRGSWIEFEVDEKKDLLYTKIDRRKKILVTLFLRAIGFDTREKIIDLYYVSEELSVAEAGSDLDGRVLAKDILVPDTTEPGTLKKLYQAGQTLHKHDVDELEKNGVDTVSVVDFYHENSLHSAILFNCFDVEESRHTRVEDGFDEPTKEDALIALYAVLQPGEPITIESAEKDINSMFFSSRRYDLGRVGRYKLTKKFDLPEEIDGTALTPQDIISTIRYLVRVSIGEAGVDDIDHLGNRRVRSVGELLQNQMKIAFSRMERIARERVNLETDTIKPQDIISIKPVVAAIKEFFGSSQLSQFMEQINPLAELTHKRRLNALGPGGLSRDRAGFEVRDVHYTHYGRMCPIETPEGPNIGLIVSLANYTRVNEYGFLETPYRRVVNGKVTDDVDYLSALEEEKYFIAQANAKIDDTGKFLDDTVSTRKAGDYTSMRPEDIQYMDVSPKQVISAATALIPFLEHDDANRALMGSNMQRQAVPLLFSEPPRVGTGMEAKAAYDSGVVIKAQRAGEISWVSSDRIEIKADDAETEDDRDVYELFKYQRTNQDTCFHQRPLVSLGERVAEGQVISDGSATRGGELAIGKNVLIGFVPWNGYNYEDAILVSENIVKEDVFTSIHIKEYSLEVRQTKQGDESLTRDVPNSSDHALEQLDSEGIVRIGAYVKSGAILVGKVTPKHETDTTPEFKLLNSIFGEKAKEVKDSSLRVPHGTEGTVVDVQRLQRSEGDDLNPGVIEVVKVMIAAKRKLREGDKMAGRHGNKGVVSRVLPVEDMPYLEDGTPLDICLNPLGVPSRMNIGQLLETQLGMAALALDQWFSTPVFQSATIQDIENKMQEAGLPTSSKFTLRDGRTGRPFENPVFVGCMYMLKLHHLVDDKMHARSTGPYSLVTQQPLGGKAQFGGQRLGEMEVWALEAYGAAHTLQELLTIKSDDMNGRVKIYESIIKSEPTSCAGIPESFNVLVQELRGLGLDMAIYDSNDKQIPFTERDEDLLQKQGSQF